ncbi:hypothetical protein SADUNF_Sadunf03G0034400 [Salix dunnii]|uniref:Aminotransferase class I/classII large domain-containing protein n=1 Tax=Salix dunnii TaxID=1413687 RepID=A0A835KD67_9ROSI|nr:hypothetical protein SADUNF_Sadunf03G0034400 [Salix dunnii]
MGSYVKLAKRAVETEMPIMVQVGDMLRVVWVNYLDDTGIGPRSEKCLVLGPGLGFPFLMFLYAVILYCIKYYINGGIENMEHRTYFFRNKDLFGADLKDFLHSKEVVYPFIALEMEEICWQLIDLFHVVQGVVYWQPPKQALNKVKELVWEPSISRYGADEGIPELREALMQKLRKENKLVNSSVMVTAGANQAFVNIVLTLCDAGDSVVMFAPYYFNAYMAFQMTGVTNILVGPGNPETLHPDAAFLLISDWLARTLSEAKPVPKVVTVRISDLCREAGSWLIVDNTYEYFMYDGLKHTCIEGDHIVNIFSFSKAYGMMGWRVGYIAYPSGVEGFQTQLLKIQDNIPICASILSQHLALYSLEMGPEWVTKQVKDLVKNRDLILEALSPLGEGAVKGGEGAIYLWAKLPEQDVDDDKVVRWLAMRHGVVVIPGGACGCPGHLRISFGGLTENDCKAAADRLKRGMEDLVNNGMVEWR